MSVCHDSVKWAFFPHNRETIGDHTGGSFASPVSPLSIPKSRPPKPPSPRLKPREVVFLVIVAAWVLAVALTDRAVPLAPPVVPYAAVAASR